MSITQETVRLNYRALGRKRGVQSAVKRAMRKVLSRITRYGSDPMDWSFAHVPKKTGKLQRALRRVLRRSTMSRIKIGVDDVDYAGFVDSFNPKINWTMWPGSVYHFFEKFYALVEKTLRKLLRKALVEEDLKKYIKWTYSRMVEEIME